MIALHSTKKNNNNKEFALRKRFVKKGYCDSLSIKIMANVELSFCMSYRYVREWKHSFTHS